MQELRSQFEQLGLLKIASYIQSGNVVFSSGSDALALKGAIEAMIRSHFQLQVPVLIRSQAELSSIRNNIAVADIDLDKEGSLAVISFLEKRPEAGKVDVLKKFVKDDEVFNCAGREFYLYCPNGYGKTKLSNTLIERKLAMQATSRNLKTVNRLLQMMST